MPVRFAFVRSAPVRFAFVRSAPVRFAFVRSEYLMSVHDKSVCDKSAFVNIDNERLFLERFEFDKFVFAKTL